MNYIFIALLSTFLIVITLLVLQVAWVSLRLKDLDNQLLKTYTNTYVASRQNNSTGKLAIYSLIIDVKSTIRCNDPARPTYDLLRGLFENKEFMLPTSCNNSIVVNKLIKPKKKGVLIVRVTPSSSTLLEDVIENKLMYIIINNQLLMISVDDEITQVVENLDIITKKVHVFVLYSIPVNNPNVSCNVNITPFMGTVSLHDNKDGENMDMAKVLNISNTSMESAIQLTGYKVL
jgi:hypothetical protein